MEEIYSLFIRSLDFRKVRYSFLELENGLQNN